MVPKLITLEDHFMSPTIIPSVREAYEHFPQLNLQRKLESLGDERIADMDAGEVAIQVMSHGPIVANVEECRRANDQLAQACKQTPSRFEGFAMLPMRTPEEATVELERAVRELGFVGALINNHEDGTFYDAERYWQVFAKAVELDVPVYMHPAMPSQAMLAHHTSSGYGDATAFMLATASWSWHTETGLHVLRLFAAGLFDALPALKLIIGHDGEMLPFMLDRTFPHTQAWGARKRDLKTVWRENVWVTTSGMFSLAPLASLLRVSPIDKIMYSVDYPFASNEVGLAFVKELQSSGLVTERELEMICHENAEKLLGLSK